MTKVRSLRELLIPLCCCSCWPHAPRRRRIRRAHGDACHRAHRPAARDRLSRRSARRGRVQPGRDDHHPGALPGGQPVPQHAGAAERRHRRAQRGRRPLPRGRDHPRRPPRLSGGGAWRRPLAVRPGGGAAQLQRLRLPGGGAGRAGLRRPGAQLQRRAHLWLRRARSRRAADAGVRPAPASPG